MFLTRHIIKDIVSVNCTLLSLKWYWTENMFASVNTAVVSIQSPNLMVHINPAVDLLNCTEDPKTDATIPN